VEFLVIWIVLAIIGAIVASNKGRSGVGWFFLCLLLTPLTILVLLALPTLKATEPQPVRLVEDYYEETKTWGLSGISITLGEDLLCDRDRASQQSRPHPCPVAPISNR
jgi:hypothetical protein